MSKSLFALHRQPTPQLRRWLAERYPASPFCTEAYAQARCTAEQRSVVMLVVNDERGQPRDGCYGFLAKRRFNLHSLEVPSTPDCEDATTFWNGIRTLGATEKINELQLNSFDSVVFDPPELKPLRVNMRDRSEYVLDLTQDELSSRFGSNHKRNIKRAQKLDFRIEETNSPEAILEHVRLVELATSRRVSRDSKETTDFSAATPRAFLETGAATLYQLHDEARALSSILVLKSTTGAYYHSAGTDPEGMRQGVSHFLIASVARSLQATGITHFNLGGVSPGQEGLRRFKTGFKPKEYALHAATLHYSGDLRRKLLTAITQLRAAPGRLFSDSGNDS